MIDNEDVGDVVEQALQVGYRHIDTAQAYGNEQGIGRAIRESAIPRTELFLTTKVAAEVKTYNDGVQAVEESLHALATDYIDLMIIHSPKPWAAYAHDERYFDGNRELWRALEEAYTKGYLKSIGVSNFLREDIDNILDSCTVKPMVNQILVHISNTPHELISYCQNNDMLVQAYSPIGHGELMKNQQLIHMAEKYRVSVPQLAIRYCLDLGLLPLPKTTTKHHLQNNIDVDFFLEEKDLETLKHFEPINDYGEASSFPVFWNK